MNKKITSALISVFYKDGLDTIAKELHNQDITIYSTGGTQNFIQNLDIPVTPVEDLTSYPAILGGRVKTLHPSVFGGILGRRNHEMDLQEMENFKIPQIDLVIVDLYPFEETVSQTTDENLIIEKIDIGGPSMIRAAAKNFHDVTVIASKADYAELVRLLQQQNGATRLDQRRHFAEKAFKIVADYDVAISHYFSGTQPAAEPGGNQQTVLRYGENPHQKAVFFGNLQACFDQLHGKEISYNNLVDIDAAIELIRDINTLSKYNAPQLNPGLVSHAASAQVNPSAATFAIIKHTNVCGIAMRQNVLSAWQDALAADPESAFGGVLVCNQPIDVETAQAINELFFEVLLAPEFSTEALTILQSKKNRIILVLKNTQTTLKSFKNAVNGTLQQEKDTGNFEKWNEVGGRTTTLPEKEDLEFANLVCKHLKSNAIALVRNKQLLGKGCGQTSRIDALRQAIEKARQFNFDLNGAVLASDAFFPFDDCVTLGYEAGITAFIQPGGSVRDKDSINFCQQKNLAMVLTGMRHFRH